MITQPTPTPDQSDPRRTMDNQPMPARYDPAKTHIMIGHDLFYQRGELKLQLSACESERARLEKELAELQAELEKELAELQLNQGAIIRQSILGIADQLTAANARAEAAEKRCALFDEVCVWQPTSSFST